MKKENLLKIVTLNEWVEEEAATRPHTFHFFGQVLFLPALKSLGKAREFWKVVCGNHAYIQYNWA